MKHASTYSLSLAALFAAGLFMSAAHITPATASAGWDEDGWHDSDYRPDYVDSAFELGLWSATYENDDFSDTAYGLRLGFGVRDTSRSTFFPMLEFGSFGRESTDRTIFGIYPISYIGEFIAVGDEGVGFSVYAGVQLGLSFHFVKSSTLFSNDNRETLFYFPIRLELGFRFYIETIYLFGSINGGWNVGIGSSVDGFTPPNLTRGQGLIGVGFLF